MLPSLAPLHAKKLCAVDGVEAELASRRLVVYFNGNPLAVWSGEGNALTGDFSRENVLLCAKSIQEAFDLTVNRIR